MMESCNYVGCIHSLDWTGPDYWTPSIIGSSALYKTVFWFLCIYFLSEYAQTYTIIILHMYNDNDTVINSIKCNHTFNNSIVERLMTVCSFEMLHSKQLEYVTKDHMTTHIIFLKLKMALSFNSLLV